MIHGTTFPAELVLERANFKKNRFQNKHKNTETSEAEAGTSGILQMYTFTIAARNDALLALFAPYGRTCQERQIALP